MRILSVIKYSLFPRRCELCGEVVELNKKRCDWCDSAVRINNQTLDIKMAYEALVSPFLFDSSIRIGIHRFKYNGFTELATAFAKEMAAIVEKEYKNVQFDAVTFVPLTRKRQRKRGYNQAELLAREISKIMNVPCASALVKTKETKTQQGSKREERVKNLKGAFEATDYDVNGKTILLVDDVKTTGSTLNECAKALKKGKAKQIYAVTIAATNGNKK